MAFEGTEIQSTVDGDVVVGYREDLDSHVGSTVNLALTSQVGVSSYEWAIIGRPEGSAAGGAGPEPIELGTGSGASFVVDNDSPYPRDGAYVVQCRINAGAPNETVKTAMLVRLSGLTTADGRTLRMLGGFETFEDTADPLVRQGWLKMLNRWLRFLSALTGSANVGPMSLRREDIWYAWGGKDFATNAVGTVLGTAGLDPSSGIGAMMAIPGFFPGTGTITKLAAVTSPDTGSAERAWIGIARNTFVGGSPYPGPTVAGSTAVVTSAAAGVSKLRGGDVSIPFNNEVLWTVFQVKDAPGAGIGWLGPTRTEWPQWSGIKQLDGLNFGATVINPDFIGKIGYVTTGGGIPAYLQGRNFPAAQPLLDAANTLQMWGNQFMPFVLYQFQR